MPRAAVFLNEGAGSARSDHVHRAVELARRALDADLHVTATRDVAELGAWMRDRMDPYSTVVIAGGDGSLGVAYNVAVDRDDLTLGYLPAGFGNATRHLLRLPSRPEQQVEVLVRGEARPVDLVAVDGRLALFAGAGWDALVAGRYAEAGARRMPGWIAAVTRSLPDLWRRTQVEVRADGWLVHRGPMELLVIGTTPFFGRGLKVNPGARPDAGVMALRVYSGPAPRLAVEAARWAFRLAPDAARVDARRVDLRSLDGTRIPVQADGDVVGNESAWSFEIRPAAVRLIGRWS
jgi:diacylglycerol kinase family enzyme